jgi:ribosome recycling factor
MIEEAKMSLEIAKEQMEKAIDHLETVLSKIRTGRASAQILESVFVEYYGSNSPINQLANITTPDARTIVVQPWDKSSLQLIEKAIINANLGFNPSNDGDIIRINVPPLTEERRKELVKMAKSETEDSKVSLRNARRDANERLRKLVKEGLAEDIAKDTEAKVQDLTNKYTAKVDDILAAKEKEILTV